MKPVLPEELSGLIDGMLDPVRAAEVRSAIEHDPQLRQQYETLLAAHQEMTTYAGRLTHRLQVAAANHSNRTAAKFVLDPSGIIVATLAMLLVRLFCKLASLPASLVVESLAFLVMMGTVSIWLMHVSDQEATQALS